jgi:hypothetical protein
MAESVGGDALGELGPAYSLIKSIPDMSLVQMISPQFLGRFPFSVDGE